MLGPTGAGRGLPDRALAGVVSEGGLAGGRFIPVGQGDRCTRHCELLTLLMADIVNYHSHSVPLLTCNVDGSHHRTANTVNTNKTKTKT